MKCCHHCCCCSIAVVLSFVSDRYANGLMTCCVTSMTDVTYNAYDVTYESYDECNCNIHS